MIARYDPFCREIVYTAHGIISTDTGKYVAHREQEHYFIKYRGFAISETELKLCVKYGVRTVILKYHGYKKTTIYKTELQQWLQAEQYNHNGDMQRALGTAQMQIAGIELKE